jgi:hypothetical protein
MTTAIYSNRVEDKEVLERYMSLPEDGSNDIELIIPSGPLFSRGYQRIVYGDHGPYIEYTRKHILLPLTSRFGNSVEELPDPEKCKLYFIWLHPVEYKRIKVYWQIKPVSDKPNAPRREDGKPSCFGRAEGYADYRRGFYYVDPYLLDRKDEKKENSTV